jgi:hypothetical protein
VDICSPLVAAAAIGPVLFFDWRDRGAGRDGAHDRPTYQKLLGTAMQVGFAS